MVLLMRPALVKVKKIAEQHAAQLTLEKLMADKIEKRRMALFFCINSM